MSACSPSSDSPCDLLVDCNLTQLVSSPTHSRGNTLDLVITNSEDLIEDLWIEDSNTHSDHFKIHFSVNTDYQYKDKRNSKYSFVYDYSKADYAGMCSFLLDKDFSDCFKSNNLDELWFYLRDIIREATTKFTPLIRISNNSKLPKWITPEIRHQIDKLRSYI